MKDKAVKKSLDHLGRRERQIMELVYRLGQATVADILRAIPEDLNYSTVRAQMTILERKGFLKHVKNGRTFVYSPVVNHGKASRAAMQKVINTFFDGSLENVVTALIDLKSGNLSPEEYDRLSALIKSMKESGKK